MRIDRNRQFLTDLFSGPFHHHAITMDAPTERPGIPGDFTLLDRPLSDWLPWALRNYEIQLQWLDEVDDDSVPFIRLGTGTGTFAAAFGCPIHVFHDSSTCALPVVSTAEEADRLPMPDLSAPSLARVFEFGQMLQERAGIDAIIGVPDIQSAFDIAALIWNKEDMFVAMYETPDAVKRLVDKCHLLLVSFLEEFISRFPECNLCHCPTAWAPAALGCWLSEDEAGSMSVSMFEEFSLPYLIDLSEHFGGLFVHCCASADQQYPSFRKIPNLRGMNRVFQSPGPRPAIEAFSGETVLIMAWMTEHEIREMLDMALPDSRFLINMPSQPPDDAKSTLGRLRAYASKASAAPTGIGKSHLVTAARR